MHPQIKNRIETNKKKRENVRNFIRISMVNPGTGCIVHRNVKNRCSGNDAPHRALYGNGFRSQGIMNGHQRNIVLRSYKKAERLLFKQNCQKRNLSYVELQVGFEQK